MFLEKERKDLLVELEMLKEDNAEIEMKLNLAEMDKGKGEGDHRQSQDGRSAATAEFSAGLENFLITYADMVQGEQGSPLADLRKLCAERLKGAISTIHLLPFFPWSSDDGFSVVDFREVEASYGNWDDVRALGSEFDLMFDLVLNHCSVRSEWFKEYVSGVEPASNYFLEAEPETDLSAVARPRSSPLLTPVTTRLGPQPEPRLGPYRSMTDKAGESGDGSF